MVETQEQTVGGQVKRAIPEFNSVIGCTTRRSGEHRLVD